MNNGRNERRKNKRIKVTCKRCGNAQDHYYQEVKIRNGVREMTMEPCINCLEDAYNNRNKDGHNEGYRKGYDDGHKEGYEYGYKYGYKYGYEDGYKEGHDDGGMKND